MATATGQEYCPRHSSVAVPDGPVQELPEVNGDRWIDIDEVFPMPVHAKAKPL
jgi:hypothetical protein